MRLSKGPAAPETKALAKHKKNADIGNKNVVFSSTVLLEQNDAKEIADGEEVTLMDWGNAIMHKVNRDESGKVVSIDAELHLEGDFKKVRF